MLRSALSIAFAALLAPVLAAQCEVHHVTFPTLGAIVPNALDGVGDVNGDGVADVAIGDPGFGTNSAGAVHIYSGATASILFTIVPPAGANRFGTFMANVGDLTGDGIAEIATSTTQSPAAPTVFPNGAAFVYSLAAPTTPLFTMTDPGAYWYGSSVAAAGDVDQDGTPDVLVGAMRANLDGGKVDVRSGATGAVIRSMASGPLLEVGSHNSLFGVALAGGVDLDGDTVPDVAVGAPHFFVLGMGLVGRVKIYSGATGAVLRSTVAGSGYQNYGYSLDFGPDLDQDGIADLIVGIPMASVATLPYETGHVRVEAGLSGVVLRDHPGISIGRLGTCVRSLGDLDADGRVDYGATLDSQYFVSSTSAVIAWSSATGKEIAAVANAVGDSSPTGEYFSALAAVGDVDGDGVVEFAAAASESPLLTPTVSHLRFLHANGSSIQQASLADARSSVGTNIWNTALVVSGCLESNGTISVDFDGPVQGTGFLFVSNTTGSTQLPGGCTLSVGLPAVIVPFRLNGDAALSAHLPTLSAPTTFHLQLVAQVSSTLVATGRTSISIP